MPPVRWERRGRGRLFRLAAARTSVCGYARRHRCPDGQARSRSRSQLPHEQSHVELPSSSDSAAAAAGAGPLGCRGRLRQVVGLGQVPQVPGRSAFGAGAGSGLGSGAGAAGAGSPAPILPNSPPTDTVTSSSAVMLSTCLPPVTGIRCRPCRWTPRRAARRPPPSRRPWSQRVTVPSVTDSPSSGITTDVDAPAAGAALWASAAAGAGLQVPPAGLPGGGLPKAGASWAGAGAAAGALHRPRR